mgnify:FL=1|jgi:S-adenosylmethionine:tRNA ribosyltransferase-isomerase
MSIIDSVRNIHISDYNYPLPDERIAKHPLAQREQCKLLYYKSGEPIKEYRFLNIPQLLPHHSMLIYNNTRVINARLRFQKETGSLIEIFCLEPVLPRDYEQIFQATGTCTWLCLVGNSKRWKQGSLTQAVNIDGRQVTLSATRGERRGNSWEIIFSWDCDDVTFASILDGIGEIPIPPYLNRKTEACDSTDYQTVYSHIDGSVAAPTAGLHFTDEVLAECDKLGIKRRELTLHVGAGTFQPVKSENLAGHEMHTEFISVPKSLLAELAATSDPVVAVGTTSVRTLESLYYVGQILDSNPNADEEQLRVTQWLPYTTPCKISAKQALQNIVDYLDRHHAEQYVGSTQLMIAPGFTYRIISGMITNFHQPQSTLLLLVSAFVGNDNWRGIYRFALDNGFRFLSYGDASLLLK